jgi:hypothetical protein
MIGFEGLRICDAYNRRHYQMEGSILLGFGKWMVPVPSLVWRGRVAAEARKAKTGLAFMTADHHRVRDLAVAGLARIGEPLAPEWFADRLSLPRARTVQILDELEAGMTFLYRGSDGAVTWAYPVTVGETPHRVAFSTGERINAA